ncbi:TPA: prepilin-type N-terminal cleavage/methylation domain-containing protein [Burkholderia vietnamiensis]|nr:prepilin-type N-terminal cleavage/methylation domain-containing protein [Burkholderia vietnamiensis]
MKINKQKGFTLIELMVACCVVVILASRAMPSIVPARMKSQINEAAGKAEGLKVAMLGSAKLNKGIPPLTVNDIGVTSIAPTNFATYAITNGHLIVTLGNKDAGSFNPVLPKINMATVDYYPVYDSNNNLLTYACTVDNSFLLQNTLLSQCTLKGLSQTQVAASSN